MSNNLSTDLYHLQLLYKKCIFAEIKLIHSYPTMAITMKDVIYQEAQTSDKKVKIGILIYRGAGDPVKHLNEAVVSYVKNEGYNEFIDANMDNPWVRVIVKGINEMEQKEFDPQTHHL